jgi:hypothetical protein
MLTQVLLAKRLYFEARAFATRQDAFSSGVAISMLQDAVELYLWALIKEKNLTAKDQAGLPTHLECLQKAGIHVPHSARLVELNKARVGFKHYGNLPAGSETKKFQTYVDEFFHLAIPEHYKIDFDSLSLVDLVADEKVREVLKLAEQKIAATEFQEAADELAKAKLLLFAAMHRYIPKVSHDLSNTDWILNSIEGGKNLRTFAYLSGNLDTLREYTLVSLLRLSLQDYLFLRSNLPNAHQFDSGEWLINRRRDNYTSEECTKALNCLVNLSVQLEAVQ